LLVSCGQWDTSSRKSKWAAKLARAGVLVEIWPVKPNQLPQWIRKRMVAVGLKPEPEAIALLAELVEGNLLAAQQEIDKLLMQGLEGRITANDINRAVADSSRFDAFRLVECVLMGKLGECLRVSSGLQRTGVAIQPVSGALHRELTVADSVRTAVQAGENESSVFSKLRIWPARQAPINQAVRRLSKYDFEESFRALTRIDLQSKGRAPGDPWQSLDRLLWKLCDPVAVAANR
jgi:DNA polymerase-3 subunit delta